MNVLGEVTQEGRSCGGRLGSAKPVKDEAEMIDCLPESTIGSLPKITPATNQNQYRIAHSFLPSAVAPLGSPPTVASDPPSLVAAAGLALFLAIQNASDLSPPVESSAVEM